MLPSGCMQLFLLATIVAPLVGWDAEGHRIVARIAGALLSKKTARFVTQHLPIGRHTHLNRAESALVSAAPWADTVADTPEYAWSTDLHFAHTPYRACAPFRFRRDCGFDGSGRCIVSAIANYTSRAADYSLPLSERADALKLLTHFVADTHQGHHIGFAEDAGATAIKLTHPNMSLHEAWDSHLLAAYKVSLPTTADSSWFGISGDLVAKIRSDPARRKVMELTRITVPSSLVAAASMATETATSITCQWAYKSSTRWIETDDSLDDEYVRTRGEIMLEQFEKAGVRLAQLLEAIASAYHVAERAAQPTDTEATTTGGASAGSGSGVVSANYFADLELPFEFDPEDYLMMVDDDSSISDEPDAAAPTSVSIVVTATTTIVPETTVVTLSKEERKRIENRKKKLRKKRVEGIDMDALVLIKRKSAFYITYRHLVVSDTYIPGYTFILSAKFAAGKSVEVIHFMLDMGAFGDTAPSMAVVQRMFYKLKGIDAPDLPAAAVAAPFIHAEMDIGQMPHPVTLDLIRYMFPPGLKVRPHFASFFERAEELMESNQAPESSVADMLAAPATAHVVDGRKISIIDDANRIFFQQMDQLVTMLIGKIQLLSRYDLLSDNSNRRWVFNTISCMNPATPTDGYYLFVDTRVFDEKLTAEIQSRFHEVSTRPDNRANLFKLLRAPLPIIDALDELSDTMHVHPSTEVPIKLALRVERFTPIIRGAKNKLRTFELILRAPADGHRLAKLMGVPPPKTIAQNGAKAPLTRGEMRKEEEAAALALRK